MQAVPLLLRLRKVLGGGTGTLIDSSIEIVSLVLPVLMHFANTKLTFACTIRRGKKIVFRGCRCCLVIPGDRSSAFEQLFQAVQRGVTVLTANPPVP